MRGGRLISENNKLYKLFSLCVFVYIYKTKANKCKKIIYCVDDLRNLSQENREKLIAARQSKREAGQDTRERESEREREFEGGRRVLVLVYMLDLSVFLKLRNELFFIF